MRAGMILVNLIEENLRGVRVVDGFDLIGKDLFASVREVGVEVDIVVDNAGVG